MMLVMSGEMGVPCGSDPLRKQRSRALSSSARPVGLARMRLKG